MSTTKPFTFICGQDDYLVGRMGAERFAGLTADLTDEFAQETVNGFAANMGEVEAALNRFRESVQTVSMFGGKRVVWLKDVNFLADSVTGRAEGTLKLVEDLQELLTGVNPAETSILITASPVDRRRAFPKWCEKNADFALAGGDGDDAGEALAGVALAEAKSLGTSFAPGALELLLQKVGANTRLIVEAAEAFFSGDLKWTLAALHRHFFSGGDARPIISALQNRNRILIQVRALLDSGDARLGPRGLDGLPKAQALYGKHFIGAPEKSSYNLFSQNAWYVGKLAGNGKLPTLRRLIDNQQEFIAAFEEIIRRPSNAQEEVLRELDVRCLAA